MMKNIITTTYSYGVNEEDLLHLEQPFAAAKVRYALFVMNPYKALGLDGFEALFC